MTASCKPGHTAVRVLCRLAWNGWADSEDSRRIIAEHEAKDAYSAAAWDRVIATLADAMKPGWQDIETAPKQKNHPIDVWVEDSRGPSIDCRRYTNAIWRDNTWMWWDAYYGGDGGGYIGLDNGVNVRVTHWMPTPAPPAAAESGTEGV